MRSKALTAEIQALYQEDDIPWVIGYSGGKDSTAVLQLIWWALARLPRSSLHKPVHVISTDTRVESPVVSAWVAASLRHLRASAQKQGLPFEPHLLFPDPKDTFWVNLIGRGYPAPRYKFRWCTERLKIKPSNRFIKEVVQRSGEALLVLGSRKSESSRRAAALSRHEEKRTRARLSPNSKLPNSLVYTPVEDWTSDEVWLYLMQVPNPWGHSNRDLLSMYRGASADAECPLVVDTTTPSCGNSRFGCWVCTLVDRDRSMEAMIQNDEQREWMQPMLDLRNELDAPDDRPRRDFRRMNGRVQLFHGEPIHGPYTKESREHWLRRILDVQQRVRATAPPGFADIEIIGLDELREIRRLWIHEKHEFDDTLPGIVKEYNGADLPAGDLTSTVLGPEEWQVLADVCGEDRLLFDVVARLLSIEERHRTKARRIGIYKEIESVLRTRGFHSRQEAVEDARQRGERKRIARDGTHHQQVQLLRSVAAERGPAES